MHNLVTIDDNGVAVTTSLAMAEGVGNEHKTVIQLIRQNIEDLQEFGPIAFGMRKGESLPQGGFAKATQYAMLNEQQATLLITYMRNNDVVRAFKKRLVKAFYELANQARTIGAIDYSSPKVLLGVLNHLQAENVQKDQLIAEQAPKVKAYEHLTRADGTMCITDAAKALEVRPKELFDYMIQNSWIYRRQGNGNLVPYQDKIQKGLLDCSMTTVYRSDGTEKITTQTRVTPKGLAQLEQNYKELVA